MATNRLIVRSQDCKFYFNPNLTTEITAMRSDTNKMSLLSGVTVNYNWTDQSFQFVGDGFVRHFRTTQDFTLNGNVVWDMSNDVFKTLLKAGTSFADAANIECGKILLDVFSGNVLQYSIFGDAQITINTMSLEGGNIAQGELVAQNPNTGTPMSVIYPTSPAP